MAVSHFKMETEILPEFMREKTHNISKFVFYIDVLRILENFHVNV